MSALATFLRKLRVNTLGEVLRDITFIGEEGGCFENFDVRTDANPWSHQEIMRFIEKHKELLSIDGCTVPVAKGYTFVESGVVVDVFWFWEGDGTLYFRALEAEGEIGEVVNYDCKKNDRWKKA